MAEYCFGVDLGGTSVKLGLFDPEGTVLEKWEIPTRKEENGSKILPDIAKAILDKAAEKNIAKEDVAGVGIGVPGPVDGKGVVHRAVNLGWDVMNINETLGGLLGMPVKAGNDANVAALGEMWCGGGKGYTNMVLATLGTGVGGGIIINGEMVTGATGAGGEIGHIHIEDNEPDAWLPRAVCFCDRRRAAGRAQAGIIGEGQCAAHRKGKRQTQCEGSV